MFELIFRWIIGGYCFYFFYSVADNNGIRSWTGAIDVPQLATNSLLQISYFCFRPATNSLDKTNK